MHASQYLGTTHREDLMLRPLHRCAAALLLLAAFESTATAQDIPYNQRVRFEAPPVALDSSTVQLSVVHSVTSTPVRALVCFDSPQAQTTVTDEAGAIRVSNLRQTNTHVRVLAPGFRETSLIFYPGKRGRSYATVRLVPAPGTESARPSCADRQRGAN